MGDKKAEPHPYGPMMVATAGTTLRDADQHVRAYRKAMASLEAFERAYWSLDRVLSWIMYRDKYHMDTPYLHGTIYPTMSGVPAVIEPAPASKLLQAVRRANKPISCFRDGKEVHGSEWEPVDFPSNPKRWPQGVFAREDVLNEWLVLISEQNSGNIEPKVRNDSTPGTKPVKFQRTKA